ncbi:hypothetical protein [Burkholderia cenocepacia]|uniref:hypothetical protein n=1 Tax=Burkholderia cenocepacia TaxID=95486 RepID=UPI002AB6238F|nr:hypothetical protein [Burkholderia cenocepacia]
MAKRRLPPGYRLGAIAFVELCRHWRQELRTDPASIASDIRTAVAEQSETFRLGFDEALALYLQSTVVDACPPIIATWDVIAELEDPFAWLEENNGHA